MLQAVKYELIPSGDQQPDMRRFADSCRFVCNKALALQKENFEAGGKFIGYVATAKHLTEWRNGLATPWLNDSPVHPLQHAPKDLELAYKSLFAKRAASPRFKKKRQGDKLPLPGVKTDQAGSGEQSYLPAEAWLAALPQRP